MVEVERRSVIVRRPVNFLWYLRWEQSIDLRPQCGPTYLLSPPLNKGRWV